MGQCVAKQSAESVAREEPSQTSEKEAVAPADEESKNDQRPNKDDKQQIYICKEVDKGEDGLGVAHNYMYCHDLFERGETKQGVVNFKRWGKQEIEYVVCDGLSIYQGDIILGKVEEIEAGNKLEGDSLEPDGDGAEEEEGSKNSDASGNNEAKTDFANTVRTSTGELWPDGIVYYVIDPSIEIHERVMSAMEHWSRYTGIRFHERQQEENYVEYVTSTGCSSGVGMKGGKQFLRLGSDCNVVAAVHEIGHLLGLYHEQARPDRDKFVKIHWENVMEGKEKNFQIVGDFFDIGPYDYSSIMHYRKVEWSKNGEDTIEPLFPEQAEFLGQRIGMSRLDADGIIRLYKTSERAVGTEG